MSILDSAVRITHQTKMSFNVKRKIQYKNKETCFKMLKARLYELKFRKESKKILKSLVLNRHRMGTSNKILCLQPYQLVKDLK